MGERKYRSRQMTTHVDDTLFGTSKKTRSRSVANNAIVITREELERTKAHSKIWTQADEEARLAGIEAEQQEKLRAARARKAKMLALEEKSRSKQIKSDIELDREGRKRVIRQLADKAIDENLDLVKMLNTLGARAQAFTIRDQQLHDKAARARTDVEYEERQDLLMEIDRLEDLKARDEADMSRRTKRVEDRKVIVEQIEAREKKKLLEEEAREQENQQMLALVARYEAEDRQAAERQAANVVRSRREVMQANDDAITRKHKAKQRERDEEDAILLYQARKDEDLRKRELEEKAHDDAVKERQRKLLAAQEKSQNTQAEVDELRARRYAEEHERRERARERREAETKMKRMGELQHARQDQAEAKKRQLAREATLQQMEYEQGLKLASDLADREHREAADKARKAKHHRTVLQDQIAGLDDKKATRNREKLEEGRKLKAEFAEERAKLEAIRDKMVLDMEKKGVNPRYLSEMKMTDIQKIQMR